MACLPNAHAGACGDVVLTSMCGVCAWPSGPAPLPSIQCQRSNVKGHQSQVIWWVPCPPGLTRHSPGTRPMMPSLPVPARTGDVTTLSKPQRVGGECGGELRKTPHSCSFSAACSLVTPLTATWSRLCICTLTPITSLYVPRPLLPGWLRRGDAH